jgi:hypothetical protein
LNDWNHGATWPAKCSVAVLTQWCSGTLYISKQVRHRSVQRSGVSPEKQGKSWRRGRTTKSPVCGASSASPVGDPGAVTHPWMCDALVRFNEAALDPIQALPVLPEISELLPEHLYLLRHRLHLVGHGAKKIHQFLHGFLEGFHPIENEICLHRWLRRSRCRHCNSPLNRILPWYGFCAASPRQPAPFSVDVTGPI